MKNLNKIDIQDATIILIADPELKSILFSGGVITIKTIKDKDGIYPDYKVVTHKKSRYSFDFDIDGIKYSDNKYELVPVNHICIFEAVKLGYKVPGLTKKKLLEINKMKSGKSLMSVTEEDMITILSCGEGFGSNAIKTHKWQLKSDGTARSSESDYRFHFSDKKINQKIDGMDDWLNVSYQCYVQAALLGYDIGI